MVLASYCLSGFAHADFKAGFAAYNRGDYALALQEFKPLAEKGDRDAQFNLAQMYAAGRGVPQDYVAAAAWFSKAAQQGDVGAQRFLGQMYWMGHGVPKSVPEAINWWSAAARNGDVLAAYSLGTLYLQGMASQNLFQRL